MLIVTVGTKCQRIYDQDNLFQEEVHEKSLHLILVRHNKKLTDQYKYLLRIPAH